MSAPILDSTKTLETKLQENKSQPLKPQGSKPKDDGAVKKNVSESGNLDRFDTQNISGVSFGRASCNQKTNTQQNQFFFSILEMDFLLDLWACFCDTKMCFD